MIFTYTRIAKNVPACLYEICQYPYRKQMISACCDVNSYSRLGCSTDMSSNVISNVEPLTKERHMNAFEDDDAKYHQRTTYMDPGTHQNHGSAMRMKHMSIQACRSRRLGLYRAITTAGFALAGRRSIYGQLFLSRIGRTSSLLGY